METVLKKKRPADIAYDCWGISELVSSIALGCGKQ